ncbi:MAG: hypothetical protein ACR2QZ_13525 [Woeseiaceae bacterium]
MGRRPFDTMKFSTQLLIPILAIAAACGGSGSTDSTPTEMQTTSSGAYSLPSDTEILAKAYDNNYSVPDGFFVDPRAETTRSYTVHHVLDESNSFEVCSDDFVEAQALEEADNSSRAVNGYFVTSLDTERYFEFVRELAYTQDVGNINDVTSPGYARIFKCTHTNRDGVDRSLLNGYSGRINPDRLDAASLREFTEYLWQFRFFNTTHKKVISSHGSGGNSTLQHTLLLVLVHNQGQDSCDRIDVVEWRFSAATSSGEISREYETLRSLEARLSAGIPTICQ